MNDLKQNLLIKIFGLLFCVSISFQKNADKCPLPYSQCELGKYGMINVHIVPHTHDDVGSEGIFLNQK